MWSRLPEANASIFSAYLRDARVLVHGIVVLIRTLCVCLTLDIDVAARAQEVESPRPIPLSTAPHALSTQILQQAILHSVWGPPAHCVVRQSVQAFGKQVSGVGEFIRGGQGSGKLKFNLRMPAGDQLNTLLQVSDGQRLLTIENIGGDKRRTEVDLGKVHAPIVLTNESLRDPVIAMYLAIGGQAEALRRIYQQYEWRSVREGLLGEVDVWWLAGKRSCQPPLVRSVAKVDRSLTCDVNSGLVPDNIQIAIGRQNSKVPFWLYQIEQIQEADASGSGVRQSACRIITEWANPLIVEPQQLTSDYFEPPSSDEPLFDETEQYLPALTQAAKLPKSVELR